MVESVPPIWTVPASGASSPAMMRKSVDLPPPEGPSSAVSDPAGMSMDTSERAAKVPNRFVRWLTVIAISSPPWAGGG